MNDNALTSTALDSNSGSISEDTVFADYADMNPYHARILRYFECDHLPPHLRKIAKVFQAIAWRMAQETDADPMEMSAALRKLLEGKDCAVRAKVACTVRMGGRT